MATQFCAPERAVSKTAVRVHWRDGQKRQLRF